MTAQEQLKAEILSKVAEYYRQVHAPVQSKTFVAGQTRINYAGRVFDERELVNLVDSSLDFWLTYGEYSRAFEKRLADYLGVRWSLLVNSGSSANLLAFMALTSPLLKDRQVKRGDEVITIACGFPTTVAPIIQYGAVPVFVDIELTTANIDVSQLEAALSPKTKTVMLAHTLGNPFNVRTVKTFCDKHNLWLIEDNCDALGSRMDGQLTGTFGDIGTSSFYPPHHITMGEGGAVYTSNPLLKKILLSLRDWGRDCRCDSGVDNTCGNRFSKQYGTLPFGYDHKYVYGHFGYNLKATDMQAAIGCAQLKKLPRFIAARKRNWQLLRDGLADLSDTFIIPEPANDSDPSWFGFLLTVQESVGISREIIVNHLEAKGIQTRMLFAGNLIKHPCFDEMRKEGQDYRIIGKLINTDCIMRNAFWVGVYPGMTEEMLAYMVQAIRESVVRSGT